MSRDDPDYLEQRAEAEIDMARSATDPRVVRAHYELATAYLDRIHPEEAEEAPPRGAGAH